MQQDPGLIRAEEPIMGYVDQGSSENVVDLWDAASQHGRVHIDPEPDLQDRLQKVLQAPNQLLEAASALLRILSEMPRHLPAGDNVLEEFRNLIDREVRSFQTLCDKASLRREHVLSARYCLCTAIDEAASSTEWGGGGVWASSSLAQRFHQDVRGGEKFFLLIGRLQGAPDEHANLLELMYRILGLGFEGVYGQSPESRRQLESVRHNLLSMLNSVREPVQPALSAHWKSQSTGKLKLLRSLPVWVSASVLGLALFAVFAWEKYGVLSKASQAEAEIMQIAKLTPPADIEQPKALRLTDLLKAEVAAGVLTVKEDATSSQVTIKGDALFAPGRAELTPKLQPAIARIAEEVAKVPGAVTVIGHSDAQPISTAEFPSNQALSEKRAASVAALLQARGVDKARLKVIGKGDTQPVGSNDTAQGRASNRRIDVLVGQ